MIIVILTDEHRICVSVLLDGSVSICGSKLEDRELFINGVLCEEGNTYSLDANDVVIIDSLRHCFVVDMIDEEEDEEEVDKMLDFDGGAGRAVKQSRRVVKSIEEAAKQVRKCGCWVNIALSCVFIPHIVYCLSCCRWSIITASTTDS